MPASLRPQPGIMDIALYEGGASTIAGMENPLKLSSNENPFGPSPAAVAAMGQLLSETHRYPSIDHADLRDAISGVYGLDAKRIICGVGSDEILSLLCYAYAGPGDEVLYTFHGFGIYKICALAAGATPVIAPERDRKVNVDELVAAITPKTRLIFIANPANPTGTMLGIDELTRLADALPETCALVLDGAYAEFADGYDGGKSIIDERSNVFMTRTFSKAYGLGGLRVGWGYGPQEMLDTLNRIRGPFNLSSIALAGATAAVKDRQWVEDCIAVNSDERARLVGGIRQLGLACDESQANFILVRFADEATADQVDAHFKENGIIVRAPKSYGLPECLRISVGTQADNTRVLDALSAWVER